MKTENTVQTLISSLTAQNTKQITEMSNLVGNQGTSQESMDSIKPRKIRIRLNTKMNGC